MKPESMVDVDIEALKLKEKVGKRPAGLHQLCMQAGEIHSIAGRQFARVPAHWWRFQLKLPPKSTRAVVPVKPKSKPPTTHPPKLAAKVKQFLAAVTGGSVSDEVFQRRMRMCHDVGGCTWAAGDGVVKAIEGTTITWSDDTQTILQLDETPIVVVGQAVQAGERLAESSNSHPCPWMRRDKDGTFCAACGCPSWRLARLDNKLKYADLECPRTPPMFKAEVP